MARWHLIGTVTKNLPWSLRIIAPKGLCHLVVQERFHKPEVPTLTKPGYQSEIFNTSQNIRTSKTTLAKNTWRQLTIHADCCRAGPLAIILNQIILTYYQLDQSNINSLKLGSNSNNLHSICEHLFKYTALGEAWFCCGYIIYVIYWFDLSTRTNCFTFTWHILVNNMKQLPTVNTSLILWYLMA